MFPCFGLKLYSNTFLRNVEKILDEPLNTAEAVPVSKRSRKTRMESRYQRSTKNVFSF